jgi:thiamine biosynthesis lipoprotein
MGTSYTVKIAGAGVAAEAAARSAVADVLAGVVALMSTHAEDSELSRFNRHAASTPFAVDPDTLAVFALARDVSAATGGAFDVTVAPIVDAWGFGPRKGEHVVAAAELAAFAPHVGWQRIAVDAARGTLAKVDPRLRADLSGIAKGYGVDLAAQALDRLGIADYMIEAGGEVRTRGANARGDPWQIAIERPDAMPQQPYLVVPLAGQSMATSGDYRIYFERDGTRYCHEIDPTSGRPIAHGLASVSVVAPTCGYADALATALIVQGPRQGYATAVALDLAAQFIVREGDGHLRSFATPSFAALGARRVAG